MGGYEERTVLNVVYEYRIIYFIIHFHTEIVLFTHREPNCC